MDGPDMVTQPKDKSPERRIILDITGWRVLAWALGFGTFTITFMMAVVLHDHVTDWETHNHHRHSSSDIWIPEMDTLRLFPPGVESDTLITFDPGKLGRFIKLPPSMRRVTDDTLTLKQRTLINWRWIQWYHGR